MKNNTRIIILLCVMLLQSIAMVNIKAQFTNTKQGIIVTVDGKQVELAVAKMAAFRLSVSFSGTPKAIPSIFIDNSDTLAAAFTVVSSAPTFGVQTSFGKLLMNTSTKKWSLYDADGKTLIEAGTITSTSAIQTINDGVKIPGALYGSGNQVTKDLIKTSSNAYLGNGLAGVPYLWNSTGYSALGVTPDDNKPAQWNKSNSSVAWELSGASADLYLWPAKSLYDATKGLVLLTGKAKIPPKWAFGYLQSKWGWTDRAYIEETIKEFRSRKHPVDAFIYDFEWYTSTPDYSIGKLGEAGFSDFNFYDKLFPEPVKQIADYKAKGIKFVGIRKPRLGNTANLDLARSMGWLKYPDSDSRDIDFSIDTLRQWYAAHNKPLLDAGIDAWWNDEGESYYSCYYWWNKGQVDLRDSVKPNDRHFSINRSFSLGNQRMGYSTWNGDILSTWYALQETSADLLNWSLSGMCYGSCDIGGHMGNPSTENIVRWFQAGVFYPIMRAHGNNQFTPRFPWLWGADGEAAIRKALNLRYQLIPFFYSLGHEAYNTGAPIMRPLVMEFPDDANVANRTDEWLMGKGLLVAPILNPGGSKTIYLPKDIWYDFQSNTTIQGPATFNVTKALDQIPMYVRAGTILPLGPVVQYTEQDTVTSLEIRIYSGKDGSFAMTEDDGKTYNYIKDSVRTTNYLWSDATNTLSWQVSGAYSDKHVFTSIKAVLFNEVKTATIGTQGSIVFNGIQLPAFIPEPGKYDTSVNVSIATKVGTIFYTTDGTNPTKNSKVYDGQINIPNNKKVTVKAFVSVDGTDYPVISAIYSVSNCSCQGKILMEKWTGILPSSVELASIPITTKPSVSSYLTNLFEVPTNTGVNDFGVRVKGYLTAPETGYYTFYVAGDDYVELSLSSNSNMANLVKIASHEGWTNSREWFKYPTQKSNQIQLNTCQNYAIEALMKQKDGGDNLAVRWVTPSGTDEVIPCKWLSASLTSGITVDDAQNNVVLYPNPSSSNVYLNFNNVSNGKVFITIFDLQGKAVLNVNENSGQNCKLNVSDLENGIYMLNVRNAGMNITKKLIIDKKN